MKRIEFEAVTDELLEKMVETIVEVADPTRIYLFGSHATGHASPESDVDLLIVQEDPFNDGHNRLSELRRIRKALRKYFIPKDILLYSEDEVNYWKESINHVLARTLREGRELYARPHTRA